MDDPGGTDEQGQVAYDCSPWAGETRRLLAGLLDNQGITHAWEGTVLVVRAEDEAVVDELVDSMAATDSTPLDPDERSVAFEMGELSGEVQNAIVALLATEGLPHAWDTEGDLVVHESDAERVEELVAPLLADAEGDEGEEMDGLVLQGHLGSLFVAADRLVHDPEDRAGIRDATAGAEALAGIGVPFGFEAATWAALRSATGDLLAAIDGEQALDAGDVAGDVATDGPAGEPADAEDLWDDPAPDPVSAAAQRLRDLLRRVV